MLDKSRIPAHVAIIMDGNGRWAKERGMVRVQGHRAGMEALREIVKHSDILGVKYLTVYAFSTENWKRSLEEVSGIFKLLVLYVASELDELNRNNVRVNIIGDWSAVPEDARNSIKKALNTTENNTGLVFNIALNYGGRAEIVRSAKALAEKAAKGELDPAGITEDMFSETLYTGGMPDPDLIIRTGGEYRLSNFLTWQSAYSELVVTRLYWPDFTPQEYEKAIEEFQGRDRRFGGVKC
ncbi:MAG: isoprenyl transferase [Clostridia bacterium]|nr:isoprenyl transferase [Clostridia bacterium]